jgi:uncharacterized membrane protein YphA (DoxX/SURF4 family)
MSSTAPVRSRIAFVAARLLCAGIIGMALVYKLADIHMTAGAIEMVGLPFPLFLACCAAAFEFGVLLAFLTGAFLTEFALMAAAYVLFLAFAFHGPAAWAANPMEFGFFTDHFTFIAGLLFAAVHGPGDILAVPLRLIPRAAPQLAARA